MEFLFEIVMALIQLSFIVAIQLNVCLNGSETVECFSSANLRTHWYMSPSYIATRLVLLREILHIENACEPNWYYCKSILIALFREIRVECSWLNVITVVLIKSNDKKKSNKR